MSLCYTRLCGGVAALRPSCALLLYRGDSTVAATSTDWDSAKSYEEMPGPKPLPVVGNIWRFLPGIGEMANMDPLKQHDMFKKRYGNIARLSGLIGRKDMVILFEPRDIEKVYRTEGLWPKRDAFQSLEYYRCALRKDVFQGVGGALTSQGKQWQDFRSKVNQPLMQPRSAKLYTGPIDDVARDFISRLRQLRNASGELPDDSINEFYKWSLESIAVVALDARMGCLSPDLSSDSEPQKLIDAVQVVFEGLFELDLKPSLWRIVSTPMWRRFVKAADVFTEVSNKYIAQAMERIQARSGESDRELSVLERLLLGNDDSRVANVMALDMLFGGIDTTSHSAAILLYYLAKNQDKQEKLHEEILRLLPESRDQSVTADKLVEMKYLKACIKESMRMSPIAIGVVRENTRDDLVLSGYRIPKGVDVIMCNAHLSNMQQHYSNPDQFIPERWLKGDGAAQNAHPFVTLPFGFGPRSCVGRRFAELEIETLGAKMIRNFRVEYHHGEVKFETRLLRVITSPLRFRLVDRP